MGSFTNITCDTYMVRVLRMHIWTYVWGGYENNGEFGHICIYFLRYWKGGFYTIVGFFSFKPSSRVSKSYVFSLVTISIFIFAQGVPGTPLDTPSHPEICLTPAADTPYAYPHPLSLTSPAPPRASSRDPTSRTSKSFFSRTQMWPNSPFFPNSQPLHIQTVVCSRGYMYLPVLLCYAYHAYPYCEY